MPCPSPHAWFREGGAHARRKKAAAGKGKEKREKGGLELNFQRTRGQVRDLGLILFGRLQPVAEAFDRLLLILRPGPNAPGLS